MKIFFLFSLIFALIGITACQSAVKNETAKSETEIKQISVSEVKPFVEKTDAQFIDVRTPEEYESGHAPRAVNYPLDEIENLIAKLDKEKTVYVICETGRRSQKASEVLQKNGFKEIYNIEGGTSGWIKAGFPVEK
jgi:rhodanese-related sulfurtransferase